MKKFSSLFSAEIPDPSPHLTQGELTISNEMEATMNALFLDRVPGNWTARAYPSMLPLGLWNADLLLRIKELEAWVSDFALPNCVWLAGFFNPQSFLTGEYRQELQTTKSCIPCLAECF